MKNNQGTVLLIVLIILIGLAAISAELSQFVLYDYALANLNKRNIQSKILAESGENLAIKLVQYNLSTKVQQQTQKYKIEELGYIWQTIMSSLESEDFSMKIIDENSFFPINNIFITGDAQKRALYYQQILKSILVILMQKNGYTGTEENAYELAEEMIKAILIWGKKQTLTLDELKEYSAKSVQCLPPKRPFENPQELNLIAWPAAINQTLVHNVINGTENNKGLVDIITTWSNGPMNIIFLDPLIIQSFCDKQNQSKEFLQQILTERNLKENFNDRTWFREIFESFALDLPSQNILFHSSRTFRFYIQVGAGSNKITMVSICTIYDNYIKWRYKNIQ